MGNWSLEGDFNILIIVIGVTVLVMLNSVIVSVVFVFLEVVLLLFD